MADTKKMIGARLKELRKQAGYTQEVLAEKVGLDARHLSRLEVGRNFPGLDTLEKIANALHVPLAEFFHFPEQESTETLRDYLIYFANNATASQLQIAIKAIKLVLT